MELCTKKRKRTRLRSVRIHSYAFHCLFSLFGASLHFTSKFQKHLDGTANFKRKCVAALRFLLASTGLHLRHSQTSTILISPSLHLRISLSPFQQSPSRLFSTLVVCAFDLRPLSLSYSRYYIKSQTIIIVNITMFEEELHCRNAISVADFPSTRPIARM